jgi:hypothetical protein
MCAWRSSKRICMACSFRSAKLEQSGGGRARRPIKLRSGQWWAPLAASLIFLIASSLVNVFGG